MWPGVHFVTVLIRKKEEETSGRFLLVGDLKNVHKIQILFVKIELVLMQISFNLI